jgi:acetyl esterase/lipase
MTWAQLQNLPLPPPGGRIAYGSDPQQFGELRLPKQGAGPFPVMILVHGGCWLAEYDYQYMTRLADWLTTQGFATWTIEYAGLGNGTGGWPSTFVDVARAADALQPLSHTAPIDLNRVYAAGHSAGGQLALWLASRDKLNPASALYIRDPVQIRGVLGLAAITDLDEYRKGPAESCHASVEKLLGGPPDIVTERYAETSPLRRLPLGITQIFIQGEKDSIVDPESVRRYVEAANAAGDRARILTLLSAGHFDTAVVTPVSETAMREALRQLLTSQ